MTNEWTYTTAPLGQNPAMNVRARLRTRAEHGWASKIIIRSLSSILRPQEEAADVFLAILAWMDAVDLASQNGTSPPAFQKENGESIFPTGKWWLNDPQQEVATNPISDGIDGDGPYHEDDEESIADENETEWMEDVEADSSSDCTHQEENTMPPAIHHSSSYPSAKTEAKSFSARPMWRRGVKEIGVNPQPNEC